MCEELPIYDKFVAVLSHYLPENTITASTLTLQDLVITANKLYTMEKEALRQKESIIADLEEKVEDLEHIISYLKECLKDD